MSRSRKGIDASTAFRGPQVFRPRALLGNQSSPLGDQIQRLERRQTVHRSFGKLFGQSPVGGEVAVGLLGEERQLLIASGRSMGDPGTPCLVELLRFEIAEDFASPKN